MDESKGRLPLGLCRQAVMKLEAFAIDIHEILEDPDLNEDERQTFTTIAEITATMGATIVNTVTAEIGEEEFLAEMPEMDQIDQWPGSDQPIGDQPIDDLRD